MIAHRVSTLLGLAALLAALSACGSPEDVSLVQISPASPEVEPGETVAFVAHVGGTPEAAEWSVLEAAGGAIDTTGTYTAPEAEGTYTVLASLQSIMTSETTQVRVKRNVRVVVSPSSATVAAGESLALTAAVTGNVKTVTWSIAEAPEGGAVTDAGVYTAPATAGIYTVVATSTADTSRSGVATITVTAEPPPPPPPPTVAIAVTPQTASLVAGNTVQFAASVTGSTDGRVTWSVAQSGGGTVTATGLYTAPSIAGTYQVVATSAADPSKQVTASVAVSAPPPTPTPIAYADVTAYGARGDGIADDTAAFRNAAATGKPLWIPRPTAHYRLSGQVTLRNGIQGDGSMPKIKMYGSSGDYAHTMFIFNQAIGTTTAPIKMNNVWLDGQWDGTTSPGGEWTYLVQIARSSNIEIYGNVLANVKGDCIYIGSYTLTKGVSDRVNIHDNKLYRPYRGAIGIISGTNGTIRNNEITKTNSYVNAIDFEPNRNLVEYFRYWTIDGNWFNSPLRGAISGYVAGTDNPPSGNVTMTNNHGVWPATSLGFWHVVTGSQPITNVALSNNYLHTAPPAP
jgi:hypothetical protein